MGLELQLHLLSSLCITLSLQLCSQALEYEASITLILTEVNCASTCTGKHNVIIMS